MDGNPTMTRLLLIILILIPTSVAAQSSNDNNYYGYLSAGGGVTAYGSGIENNSMMIAAGGEAFVHKGLAAGAEIGMHFPPSRIGSAIGIFSPNISWHFLKRSGRISPIITGDYSLFFRDGTSNGFKLWALGFGLGGGVIWWFRDGVGLRLEARDFIPTGLGPSTRHLISFRAGVAFR